jgi:hypothetical protein
MIIYFNAERQRPLLVMGSLVLLYRESCALKTNVLPRWIRTGDEVIIDENNDLFIVDRLKVDRFLFITCLVCHPEGIAVYLCRKF